MRPIERVAAKLEECRPYHEYLLALRPRALAPDADYVVWGAVGRYLQVVIECAIDVGEMLISIYGLERPEENRDVFRVLGGAGILEPDLAARLRAAAGLRNLIVHQYARLDRARLRGVLVHGLDDLEAFHRRVAEFVRRAE